MIVSQYFPVKFDIHYKQDKICQGNFVFGNHYDTFNNTSHGTGIMIKSCYAMWFFHFLLISSNNRAITLTEIGKACFYF